MTTKCNSKPQHLQKIWWLLTLSLLLAVGALIPVNNLMAQGYSCLSQLPPRSPQALPGSAFMNKFNQMNLGDREAAIITEISSGNIPEFLRQFREVTFTENNMQVTLFVLPDVLAIGSNEDFVRIPMNRYSAESLAKQLGCHLPTTKISDQIYAAATIKLRPIPLNFNKIKNQTIAFTTHQRLIQKNLPYGYVPGQLIAGHKKDLVWTKRLWQHPGPQALALYGWHQPGGSPTQPLSLVHAAAYVDYSHGVRLVNDYIRIDGKLFSLSQVLQDPLRASLVSKEGLLNRTLIPGYSAKPWQSVSGVGRWLTTIKLPSAPWQTLAESWLSELTQLPATASSNGEKTVESRNPLLKSI